MQRPRMAKNLLKEKLLEASYKYFLAHHLELWADKIHLFPTYSLTSMSEFTPNSEDTNLNPSITPKVSIDIATESSNREFGSESNTNERISSNYEEQASAYLQCVSNAPFTQHYMEQTRIALDLHQGDRIFDLGCGRGVDLQEIAEVVAPNGEVYGLDNAVDMVNEANSLHQGIGNIIIRLADGEQLPFDDNYFDAGRSIRVLQHVENLESVLAEMQRVTKTGGKIVVLDPDWKVCLYHL